MILYGFECLGFLGLADFFFFLMLSDSSAGSLFAVVAARENSDTMATSFPSYQHLVLQH